jgi:predicted PolB exonuclease-like 3'-5' exonuclease
VGAFCDKIAELKPQLVTFNGNSFHLPVLRYRAMIHAVAAPGLAARLYFNRYTEDAVDLCDILASFAPHTKASLNELSKIMGPARKAVGHRRQRGRAILPRGQGQGDRRLLRDGRRQHVSGQAEVRAISRPD